MRGSSSKFCAIIFTGEKTKKQSTEKITNFLGMVLKRNIYKRLQFGARYWLLICKRLSLIISKA
jgi:hypothetical protein